MILILGSGLLGRLCYMFLKKVNPSNQILLFGTYGINIPEPFFISYNEATKLLFEKKCMRPRYSHYDIDSNGYLSYNFFDSPLYKRPSSFTKNDIENTGYYPGPMQLRLEK